MSMSCSSTEDYIYWPKWSSSRERCSRCGACYTYDPQSGIFCDCTNGIGWEAKNLVKVMRAHGLQDTIQDPDAWLIFLRELYPKLSDPLVTGLATLSRLYWTAEHVQDVSMARIEKLLESLGNVLLDHKQAFIKVLEESVGPDARED